MQQLEFPDLQFQFADVPENGATNHSPTTTNTPQKSYPPENLPLPFEFPKHLGDPDGSTDLMGQSEKPRHYSVTELITGISQPAEKKTDERKAEEYRRDLVARLVEQIPQDPLLYSSIYGAEIDGLLHDFKERWQTDVEVADAAQWVVNACEFILQKAEQELLIKHTSLLLREMLSLKDKDYFAPDNYRQWNGEVIGILRNGNYWENKPLPPVYNNAITIFSYFEWLRLHPERTHLGNARLTSTSIELEGPEGEQKTVTIGSAFLDNVSLLHTEVNDLCESNGVDICKWGNDDRQFLVERKRQQAEQVKMIRQNLGFESKPKRGKVPELLALLEEASVQLRIPLEELCLNMQINEYKVRADPDYKAKQEHARQLILYIFLANLQARRRWSWQPISLGMSDEDFEKMKLGKGRQGNLWKEGLVYLLPGRVFSDHGARFDVSLLAMLSRIWWDAFGGNIQLNREELNEHHAFVKHLQNLLSEVIEDYQRMETHDRARLKIDSTLREIEVMFNIPKGTLTLLSVFFPESEWVQLQREQSDMSAAQEGDGVPLVQQELFHIGIDPRQHYGSGADTWSRKENGKGKGWPRKRA